MNKQMNKGLLLIEAESSPKPQKQNINILGAGLINFISECPELEVEGKNKKTSEKNHRVKLSDSPNFFLPQGES